jgi:hypothetical protein
LDDLFSLLVVVVYERGEGFDDLLEDGLVVRAVVYFGVDPGDVVEHEEPGYVSVEDTVF